MLLTLPPEIWGMIFDLLLGKDLQSISKVPSLSVILTITPSSAHRLEVHRAGTVEASPSGSLPLAERSELLQAFRAQWEHLRWTGVSRLPLGHLCCYQFAGTTLVYTTLEPTPVIHYLRLPFGGTPASSWEDHQLELNNASIVAFSAQFRINMLIVLEALYGNVGTLRIRLHVKRLDSAQDITVVHGGQLKVCEPFTADIDLDTDTWREYVTYKIEQTGCCIAMLFTCYGYGEPGWRAKFVMWDVITQTQVAGISSEEYQTFLFLDHRWVLFGGIRRDPDPEADCLYYPYLKIIDPTSRTCSTTLALDKSVFNDATKYSTINIRVRSGAGLADCSLAENEGIPFVSGASRGIICAEVYWQSPRTQRARRSLANVFVLDIEEMLSKVPSALNLRRHRVKWKDLSSSTAVLSYGPAHTGLYRVPSGCSCVAGFRYASPTQLLDPKNPMGPRCFFVYDFNPHRGTPDILTSAAPRDPDLELDYEESASEITREVVGGLSCWKTRFDLPAAGEDHKGCPVALTDGGFVLLEDSITVFSIY